MRAQRVTPLWQQALIILSGVVVGLILIIVLKSGRPIFFPIGLAILLTFLVNPIVKSMHRFGMNRLMAVTLSVAIVGVMSICLAWVVGRQVTAMIAELPKNTEKINAKVKTLKELGSSPTRDRLLRMFEEISDEIHKGDSNSTDEQKPTEAEKSSDSESPAGRQLNHIIVESGTGRWAGLTDYVASAVEILATVAFALVLLIFFLIEREDLRDRIVLLAGKARLALTSKAVSDISDRVSRYISMVVLVNGGFGLVLMLGLLGLRVPYALLWGVVAATLRFLPYIGPWIGMIFPIMMSVATSDGWWQPLMVFLFIFVVELVTNNVFEPLVFGHTTGVSPTALLVSAAFWLYLWGPVGLIFSAPFAVCLVVLGKNVKELEYLYLLLGDKPALESTYNYYQRIMLGDYDAAISTATNMAREKSPEQVFDEFLIPVLKYLRRDVRNGHLSENDETLALDEIHLTMMRLQMLWESPASGGWFKAREPLNHEAEVPAMSRRRTILACPAMDETDRLGLEMMKLMLDPHRWDLTIASTKMLTSELIDDIHANRPDFVFIMSIPPGGMSHTRYLCKRLRQESPESTIIVGRIEQSKNFQHIREQLEFVGATLAANSLKDSLSLLNSRWPLVNQSELSEPCQS